ncbi:MAG: hypothetical protein J5I41_10575 [Saprospiraceae bacterium]|nr:hypothetical protein [Saprospiraceae bacterium]
MNHRMGDNIIDQNLSVQKTARYYRRPALTSPAKGCLFGLHGYAQAALPFLQELIPAVPNDWEIIAPEGLSRFYRKGTFGDVVASWMTKEDRIHEIEDHCRFLEQLHDIAVQQAPAVPLRVLGFSQGVATAWRWLCTGNVKVERLILWAGRIPTDTRWPDVERRPSLPVQVVAGDQDEWVNEGILQENLEWLNQQGIPAEAVHFRGGHVLDPTTLSRLLKA